MNRPELPEAPSDLSDAAAPIGASGIEMLQSAARRRALLRGLGKGAAIAGASMPLSSLATYGERKKLVKKDLKNYHCSVSGHMSVMLSGGVTQVPTCAGKPRSYWKTRSYWPYLKNNQPACYFGSVLRSHNESFFDCFGWSLTTRSIGNCIDDGDSEEADWVCAVLNANIAAHNYPYSSAAVVNHSKGLNMNKAAALAFHQGFSRSIW